MEESEGERTETSRNPRAVVPRVYGESKHQLDEKYRLNIPKRLLPLFEDGGFLTRAYNGFSLVFYMPAGWDAQQARLDGIKETLLAQYPTEIIRIENYVANYQRFLNCGQEVTLDGQAD